jgi:hypothetical protein
VAISSIHFIPSLIARFAGDNAVGATAPVAIILWGVIIVPLGFMHVVSNAVLRLFNVTVLFVGGLLAFVQYALAAVEASLSVGYVFLPPTSYSCNIDIFIRGLLGVLYMYRKFEIGCMAALAFAMVAVLAGLPVGRSLASQLLFSTLVGVPSAYAYDYLLCIITGGCAVSV